MSHVKLVSLQVQQLREEESQLRQENLQLKEEILKLQQHVTAGTSANRYAPPVQEETIPMLFIAFSVIVGFIGIILGKFVL